MADGDFRRADFADWFDFSRPVPANYRSADGVIAEAAENVPRFDHAADGGPLGLIVEPGSAIGRGDRTVLQAGVLAEEADRPATVFHAISGEAGAVERRAYYTRDPRATINTLLATVARHRAVGVIPGYRPNRGGFVRYRGLVWLLAGGIADGAGPIPALDGRIGDGIDRPLLAG